MQIQKPRQGYKLVKSLFGKYEEIPERWMVTTINNLGEIVTGTTPSTENREYYGDEFLWATPTDLVEQKYVEKTKTKLTKRGFKITRKITTSSVLFVCIGSTIGKVGMALKEMATNQQINSIICKENDPNFVYYQLLFNSKKIKNMANQVAIPILNKTDFGTIKILIPYNITEQQRIASILSNVDSLINQTQRIIEQTQKLKKGLVQKLLTKGIGHTKFKMVKWLFGKDIEIPEEWELQKLENIVEILDSKRIPIEESERGKRHGDYPYYGASGIIDYIDDYIFDERLLCLAEDGENLRSKVLPIAFTIEGKTWVNNHAHVLRTKETTEHYFLEYFLNHLSFLKYVASTAQPKLNQKDMRSILIICPTKLEQQKIASILSDTDSQIQKQQQYKSNLEILKKGLMQKLLTGQIKVKV